MLREWSISWRLLRHELRRGELTIMALAIALAVAAVLALSLFSERLQQGLVAQSSAFMAADRVLGGSQPAPAHWLQQASALEHTQRVTFRSMVFSKEQLALAQIKAVGEGYPLRGKLMVATEAFAPGEATNRIPGSGEVWVHSALVRQLGLALGDSLEVGEKNFTLTQVLIEEPDASLNVFNDQPTVMLPLTDLAATGLIQPGSRVRYDDLFAGAVTDINNFEAWLIPKLDPLTQRWRSVQGGDSPLAAAMQRADRFMLLASLLGVVLAATAVAVAAQRYSQRNYDAVAIMKALGGSKKKVGLIFVGHLVLLSAFSIAAGLLLGYVLQAGVVMFVSQQLGYVLPHAGWSPWWLAVVTGLVTAIMFSLYPLLRLLQIPPLRVLRREMEESSWGVWLHAVFCAVSIFLLMLLYSKQWLLSAALFAGGLLAAIVLFWIGQLFIRLSRTLGMQAGSSWRLAMANMQRRGRQNSIQMISFATAIMLFLLVLALRNELLVDWQKQLPENAPNYFLVNVKGEQIDSLQALFNQERIQATDFYPITPGRLLAVNGQLLADAVPAAEREQESAEREGFGRELQLTWRSKLPDENKLVAGAWWTNDDDMGVSVESGVAERMQIALGDMLTFRIGADDIQVPVQSIREVNWNNMQPNFYMIFNPAALAQVPVTYIGSFYLPPQRQEELYGLLRDYSQVSLIDVAGVMDQVRTVIGHVSLAITFVMVLVVLAGALVLVAQVQASLDERQQELVILRTLGAKQRLLSKAVLYEFLVLGALAGFIAALAMELSVLLLQSQVFQMPASLHPRFWLLGPVVGACLVACLGWLSIGRLMRQRTAHLIRFVN